MAETIGWIVGAFFLLGDIAVSITAAIFVLQAVRRPDPAARDRAAIIAALIGIFIAVRNP